MATKGRPLKKPKKNAVVFGKNIGELFDLANALLNADIVNGTSNEVVIGDRKIIFKIKASTAGSGNSSYRGEYEPTGATPKNPGPFVFGDIVRVSPTNSLSVPMGGTIIPGVYICYEDGPGDTDYPNHPLSAGGETEFWQCISTYPYATTICKDGVETDVFADLQPKDPPP